MFWNKATPIDHKEDVCCLCGKNVTSCKITGLRFRHTRDDCIEYLTGRIDYFGRQANCQASDHEDRICELKRENESQLHAICILDSQISKLENANKDISSLLRKALLRIDSLAGDISKLYSREPSAVLIGHYDIPKTTKPRPKARPKKDTST